MGGRYLGAHCVWCACVRVFECIFGYLCMYIGLGQSWGLGQIQQAAEQQSYNTNTARIVRIYVDMDVGEATQGQVEVTETAGRTVIDMVVLLLAGNRFPIRLSLRLRHCSIRFLLNVDHEPGQGTVWLQLGSELSIVRMDSGGTSMAQHSLLALQEWLVEGLQIVVVQIADQGPNGGGTAAGSVGAAGCRSARSSAGVCGGVLSAIFRHAGGLVI